VPRYSDERKAAVLAKLSPPHSVTVAALALEEGISDQTLYNWRTQAREEGRPVPGSKAKSDQWSAEAKLATVIETATLSEEEFSQYCREKGLYPEQFDCFSCPFADGVRLIASLLIVPLFRVITQLIHDIKSFALLNFHTDDVAVHQLTDLLLVRAVVHRLLGILPERLHVPGVFPIFIASPILYYLGQRRARKGLAQLRPTAEEVRRELALIP
jgi:transposase-like protein